MRSFAFVSRSSSRRSWPFIVLADRCHHRRCGVAACLGRRRRAVAVALFLLALGTFVRRFKAAVGNNDIEFWMISNRIMPPIVAVLPIYVMFQHLKMLDTKSR